MIRTMVPVVCGLAMSLAIGCQRKAEAGAERGSFAAEDPQKADESHHPLLTQNPPKPEGKAGDIRGNGGDGIACLESDGLVHVQLFDFYEAEAMRGIRHDLGGAELTTDAKVELALGRVERLDPDLAAWLRGEWATFGQSLRFTTAPLADVPDQGDTPIATACTLVQVAIQRTPEFPHDTRYLVHQPAWERMDADNQAGLIMHELLYRAGVRHGHKDSRRVRYLNSLITSQELETWTIESFKTLLIDLIFYRDMFDHSEYWIMATFGGQYSWSEATAHCAAFGSVFQGLPSASPPKAPPDSFLYDALKDTPHWGYKHSDGFWAYPPMSSDASWGIPASTGERFPVLCEHLKKHS